MWLVFVGCCFEVGGEDERTVAFTRQVAERRRAGGRHHQNTHLLSVTQPVCNAVTVLDSSASTSVSASITPLLRYSDFVLEYIDHGAFYYRRFFYDFGAHM